MRFQILGRLTVTDGGSRVNVGGTKQRALLALLLLERGRVVSAGRIIDELWGTDPPRKPRNAVQAKVSGLRRALAPGDPDRGRRIVRGDGSGYWLDVPEDAVDLAVFETLVADARHAVAADQPALAYESLREAEALCGGDPLSDLLDFPFASPAAEQLAGRYLSAMELQATAWLAMGAGDESLPDRLLSLVKEHPLRESLRASAMRALAVTGRQAEALQLYTDGRELLAESLGVDPGAELRAAHADVLAQQPGDRPKPPPVVRLPGQTTSFVGRQDEDAALRALLGKHRLVTVTGTGGIGKTRLVVHTLASMAAPVDGIWFADLRDVGDGDTSTDRLSEVADKVLRTVRTRDGSSLGSDERLITDRQRDPLARMCDGIGARDAVLVLDNCEHVSADVSAIARQLLAACPNLRLVTTTRILLGLVEEAVLRLDPLPVPPAAAGRDARLRSEAVKLFCARAELSAEQLSDSDLDHVVSLVRRTDGIPLAMEVAAGLLRSMTLPDVADHLREDRELLQDAADCRLVDTIARSWDLLTAAETELLTRVATIEGRWGLDAACALADSPRKQVVATVARLVDRSLVHYDPATPRAPYLLLEPIRDYAGVRLDAHPKRREITLAHARYFLELATAADPSLRGPAQTEAFALVNATHADVLKAIRTFTDENMSHEALTAATALGWFWWLSGRRREGRSVLTSVLTWVPCAQEETLHARTARAWAGALGFTGGDAEEAIEECIRALDGLPVEQWDTGLFLVAILVVDRLYQRGDPVRGRRFLDSVELLAERADDEWYTAAARLVAGIEAMLHGRLPEGRHFALASLAGFEASQDVWGQTQSLDLLAGLDEMAGDYQASRKAREQVIALSEKLGLTDAYQAVRVGNLHALDGDLAGAERTLRQARELAQQTGSPGTVAYADNGLGLVLRRRGHPEQALVRHEAAWRHYRSIGSIAGIAFTASALGLAATSAGQLDDARRWLRRALQAADASGDRRALALVLECLAVTFGPSYDAAVLLGAANTLRADAGAPRPHGEIPEIDAIDAGLREAVTPGDVERGLVVGKDIAAARDAIVSNVEGLLDAAGRD